LGKLLVPILAATIIAGVGDLIYAFIHFQMVNPANTPQSILQSIASGWIGGPAARDGGVATAVLGGATEFLLTFIMASVYIVAAQWITDLRKYWWVLGPAYGVVVMVVMYSVVLPLAANHGGPNLPDGALILANCKPTATGKLTPGLCTGQDHQMLYGTILIHIFDIGLVIAACARFLWPKSMAADVTPDFMQPKAT
jgi:hypothetical protein